MRRSAAAAAALFVAFTALPPDAAAALGAAARAFRGSAAPRLVVAGAGAAAGVSPRLAVLPSLGSAAASLSRPAIAAPPQAPSVLHLPEGAQSVLRSPQRAASAAALPTAPRARSLARVLARERAAQEKLAARARDMGPAVAKAESGRLFHGNDPGAGSEERGEVEGSYSRGRPELSRYFGAKRAARAAIPAPSASPATKAERRAAGNWKKRWLRIGAVVLGLMAAGALAYALVVPRLRPVQPPERRVGIEAPYKMKEDPAARVSLPAAGAETARLYTLAAGGFVARSVTESADGKAVVTVGADGSWRYWDRASGRALAPESYPGKARAALFADGGRRLILLDEDATVRILELDTGKARTIKSELGLMALSAFSPDAQRVTVVTADRAVHLLELGSGAARAFRTEGKVLALGSSDRGEIVLTVNRGLAKLWLIEPGKEPAVALEKYMPGVKVVDTAVSRDGKVLFLAADMAGDQLVVAWRFGSEEVHQVSADELGGGALSVAAVAASADGARAAVLNADGRLYLWTPGSGKPALVAELGAGREVQFSADGATLFAIDGTGAVHAFRIQ